MKELTRQKLIVFRNALSFLWQELKTLNIEKIKALKNLIVSYVRIKYARIKERHHSGVRRVDGP